MLREMQNIVYNAVPFYRSLKSITNKSIYGNIDQLFPSLRIWLPAAHYKRSIMIQSK